MTIRVSYPVDRPNKQMPPPARSLQTVATSLKI